MTRPDDILGPPRSAIVVGAASGMGKCASELLSANGCALGLIDRNAHGLEVLATALRDQAAAPIVVAPADVSDRSAVDSAFATVAAGLQRPPSAILHFAGMISDAPFESIDAQLWDTVLDVNLRGTFLVCRAATSLLMRRDGPGAIVLTSSVAARMGPSLADAAYAASKGGVNALTRTLARQLGPRGIRVNAISPGQTLTPMLREAWEAGPPGRGDQIRSQVEASTPLRRLGTPWEMARAAIFLASQASSYVTGEVLEVNGGIYFD